MTCRPFSDYRTDHKLPAKFGLKQYLATIAFTQMQKAEAKQKSTVGGAEQTRKQQKHSTSGASEPNQTKVVKLISVMAAFLGNAARVYTISEMLNDFFKDLGHGQMQVSLCKAGRSEVQPSGAQQQIRYREDDPVSGQGWSWR